jgi:cell wall-associated NlpC family hydrolase
VGTPYRWGGENDAGFDCSGLVQAAYAAAGVTLPRVAQDQFDAGPVVAPGARLEPGDLVFFGGGPSDVLHVGIVVTPGIMVDAPHAGASVREEWFPTTPGGPWGDEHSVGATRPAM